MYFVIAKTPEMIVWTYIIVLSACLLTYPVTALIMKAVRKGAGRWK
ncbi:hypothetical protein [Rossellomorea marisflavi]|jgi:hypothetical protein